MSAADLLSRPDPGGCPWLVEGLASEGIVALVGAPKSGKSWLALEIAFSLVTGLPALGELAVPKPGPVALVCGESTADELNRRIRALALGRDLDPDDLGSLHVMTSDESRVRLDEQDSRAFLSRSLADLAPRLVIFDPLARLKGAEVDEDRQNQIGPVLDYLAELRHETGASIMFVHHTGHAGKRMRGSSDLEAIYQSKITVGPRGKLVVDHRDAPSRALFVERVWEGSEDQQVVSLAVRPTITESDDDGELQTQIVDVVRETPGISTEGVRKAVGLRKKTVRSELDVLDRNGVLRHGRSESSDRRRGEGWYLASESRNSPVPVGGTDGTDAPTRPLGPTGPTPMGRGRGSEANGGWVGEEDFAPTDAASNGRAPHQGTASP